MARYRSILALVLALATAFLVSCGSPKTTKTSNYTTVQVEQIQQYVSNIEAMRDRLPELAKSIQAENWTDVKNFIHGPLGELRWRLGLVERSLLPEARAKATAKGKEVFESLNAIDLAAQSRDYKAAIRNYAAVQKNLDAFLELAPQA